MKKVLIANRGEIAVRIVRALHVLGYRAVAVYSSVDRDSPHVRMADEAHLIGPAAPLESYLNQEAVLEAAKRSGAEMIHPGYGFLAENASFAKACEQAGLTFIGPSSEAIEVMGDKLRAREAAKAAGVPVVPGAKIAADLDSKDLEKAAASVGFPVILKSVGGGGGKGMRVVHKKEDLASAFRAAQGEAKKAFDNAEIYLEKYLPRARHVEIQVAGDRAGDVVHFGERECSVQRRHQKVIEESPCPSLTEEIRDQMGRASVDIARRIRYQTVGTVEFLMDFDGNFYFLEMNTRLQVEHPVTELVTGIDLVALQIRLAEGEPLGLVQDRILSRGHAIEARICAEDPYLGFVPSVGTVEGLSFPAGPNVRVDSGIERGQVISLFYDPILAKIIAFGADRGEAMRRLELALRELRINGVKTTAPLVIEVLNHPKFKNGLWDTAYLESWLNGLDDSGPTPSDSSSPENAQGQADEVAAAVATLLFDYWERGGTPLVQLEKAVPPVDSPWIRKARSDGLRGLG